MKGTGHRKFSLIKNPLNQTYQLYCILTFIIKMLINSLIILYSCNNR